MQKGRPGTAGSKILENFISPINATVVELLEAANVEIIGTGETSEFGVAGLFNESIDVSIDVPTDDSLINSIVSDKADFALCNDYTGAISRAAAEQGLCYLHPTYGTVSRYGLVPVVSSIDQIGIVCKVPRVGFDVLKIISKYDEKDGVMSPMCNAASDSIITKEQEGCHSVTDIRINEIEPMFAEVYTQIMQIICCAELSNNISRYDGVKFGYRANEYNGLQELYVKTRTEGFGADTKLAAIIGTMVLSHENYTRFYDKAMRLRRMIMDSMKFDTYDVVVGRGDNSGAFIMLSRLCGLPSVTTRDGTYIANVGCEVMLQGICTESYEGSKGESA